MFNFQQERLANNGNIGVDNGQYFQLINYMVVRKVSDFGPHTLLKKREAFADRTTRHHCLRRENMSYNFYSFTEMAAKTIKHLQSSLTIQNASSGKYTLAAIGYVSLMIPFVAAYIWYAWAQMNKTPITKQEMEDDTHAY